MEQFNRREILEEIRRRFPKSTGYMVEHPEEEREVYVLESGKKCTHCFEKGIKIHKTPSHTLKTDTMRPVEVFFGKVCDGCSDERIMEILTNLD